MGAFVLSIIDIFQLAVLILVLPYVLVMGCAVIFAASIQVLHVLFWLVFIAAVFGFIGISYLALGYLMEPIVSLVKLYPLQSLSAYFVFAICWESLAKNSQTSA